MGKKSKVLGATVEMDLPITPPPVVKAVPVKRVMSEKQKDNLKKGMMALKAKRDGLRKEQEEDSSAAETTSQPVEAAEPSPTPTPAPAVEVKTKRTYNKQPKKEVLGLEEFNTFKNDLLTKLQPREVIKEVSVDRIVDRPIVTEKVVEKERFISSSELLNKIFFS